VGRTFQIITFLIICQVLTSSLYAFSSPQGVWNWIFESDITETAVSQDFVFVGVKEWLYLFDNTGSKRWAYRTGSNVTAVAISELEDYVVAASRDGSIYVLDVNGTLIKSLPYYAGNITGFDLGKPNRNVTNAVFPYPEKGHFLALGNISGSKKQVFIFRFNLVTGNPEIMGLEDTISNYSDPCSPSLAYIDRVSYWESEISIGAGQEVGELGLGEVNSHCSWGNYTILSTSTEETNLVTLFDFSKKNSTVLWQLEETDPVENAILFPNGSYALTYTGSKLSQYYNPSYEEKRPDVVVLANDIDYSHARDFIDFLKSSGLDVTSTNISNFEHYKTGRLIIILGGPDAYDGVGGIVREVLTNNEGDAIREPGAKLMYKKSNVWMNRQKVVVIAGSGREQTKQAHYENRDDAALYSEV